MRQLGHAYALNAELVGEQQPGPGLPRHDADARRDARGKPYEPQRLRGVDELRHVVDDDRARLSERGTGHAPTPRERPGMRARERVDVRPAGLERHDRHVARELLDSLDEAPSIGHALDRQSDDLNRSVPAEVVENVGEPDVGAVSKADAKADAEVLAGREKREGVVHPATLGDDREAACREICGRPDEGRAEPGCRVEEARGVRPEDPEPRGASEGDEARLELDALFPGFGPAAGMDDGGSDPCLRTLGENARDSRSGDGNQRQVDRLGNVGHAGGPWTACNVLGAGIHCIYRPGEGGEAAHQGVAGLTRSRRCSDDGDGARREEPAERTGCRVGRAACDRAQPASRAVRATSSGSTLEGRSNSKRSVVRGSSRCRHRVRPA